MPLSPRKSYSRKKERTHSIRIRDEKGDITKDPTNTKRIYKRLFEECGGIKFKH